MNQKFPAEALDADAMHIKIPTNNDRTILFSFIYLGINRGLQRKLLFINPLKQSCHFHTTRAPRRSGGTWSARVRFTIWCNITINSYSSYRIRGRRSPCILLNSTFLLVSGLLLLSLRHSSSTQKTAPLSPGGIWSKPRSFSTLIRPIFRHHREYLMRARYLPLPPTIAAMFR